MKGLGNRFPQWWQSREGSLQSWCTGMVWRRSSRLEQGSGDELGHVLVELGRVAELLGGVGFLQVDGLLLAKVLSVIKAQSWFELLARALDFSLSLSARPSFAWPTERLPLWGLDTCPMMLLRKRVTVLSPSQHLEGSPRDLRDGPLRANRRACSRRCSLYFLRSHRVAGAPHPHRAHLWARGIIAPYSADADLEAQRGAVRGQVARLVSDRARIVPWKSGSRSQVLTAKLLFV